LGESEVIPNGLAFKVVWHALVALSDAVRENIGVDPEGLLIKRLARKTTEDYLIV
jgi:hypothetical protein